MQQMQGKTLCRFVLSLISSNNLGEFPQRLKLLFHNIFKKNQKKEFGPTVTAKA